MRSDEDEVQSCPKCGKPRLAYAWDCSCGHVFEGSGHEPAPRQPATPEKPPRSSPPVPERGSGMAPPPAAPASGDEVSPQPAATSAARRAGAPGLRGWIDENIGLAVALAIALYLTIFFVMSTVLVSSTDDPTRITRQYRAVLGESPPTEFQPAFSLNVVGRRLAVFFNPLQGQTLLLYSESWLAGRSDVAALARVPDRALRFLEVDYSDLGRQSGTMLRIPVEIRGIDLNLGGTQVRGFIASMTGRNGRPALLCLVGAPDSTTATARQMFRRE